MTWSLQQDQARFGRLTILEDAEHRGGQRRVLCVCDCGSRRVYYLSNIRRGATSSCGCYRAERTAEEKTKHGHATRDGRTAEYRAWRDMIARCTNETRPAYHDYGGRGIAVCSRWRFGEGGQGGFECFLEDMGRKPSPLLSLDRINNDGDYAPGNCRWATRQQQNLNTRRNGTRAAERVTVVQG